MISRTVLSIHKKHNAVQKLRPMPATCPKMRCVKLLLIIRFLQFTDLQSHPNCLKLCCAESCLASFAGSQCCYLGCNRRQCHTPTRAPLSVSTTPWGWVRPCSSLQRCQTRHGVQDWTARIWLLPRHWTAELCCSDSCCCCFNRCGTTAISADRPAFGRPDLQKW